MTLHNILDLLLAADWSGIPRDVALTRAVLLAYELGLEHGSKNTQAPALEEEDAHDLARPD